MSRQERRARLRESVRAVTRRGIDLDASQPEQLWSMIGLTRILIDILGGHSPMRASEAVRRAHDFFEVSLRHNPSDHKIDCAKGCAFCCHLRVTTMAPELFHVANFIRKRGGGVAETIARVRAADSGSRDLSARERPKHKVPCGLLEANSCSVYEARPSSCRGLTSISVATCERGYNGEDVQVMTPGVWTEIRRGHNQALWAALSAVGLSADSYELNHGVLVALETPDAEARWLKGEDVFAHVSCDRLNEGEDAPRKKRVIELLIAGALGRELPG